MRFVRSENPFRVVKGLFKVHKTKQTAAARLRKQSKCCAMDWMLRILTGLKIVLID